jgi:hypothetical protein
MWFHKTYLGEVSHSNKHEFVEKLMSFERQQELCWKLLYQNLFYMFIKILDENFKKLPPK